MVGASKRCEEGVVSPFYEPRGLRLLVDDIVQPRDGDHIATKH
jgi:hypothetical protein